MVFRLSPSSTPLHHPARRKTRNHHHPQPLTATANGTTSLQNSSNSATQGIGKQEHGEKFGEQLPKEGVIGQMFHKAVSGDEQGMQGRTTTAG